MSLQNIKRGDQVFIVRHGWRASDGVVAAEYQPMTAAGPKYVTADGTKFHRGSGDEVSDFAARRFAYVSEESWRAASERAELVQRAHRLACNLRAYNLSDEQLRALIALMEAA